MILKADPDLNIYYIQTLCMVFFPGAKFRRDEEPGEEVPEVTVHMHRESDGTCVAYASIKVGDLFTEETVSVSPEDHTSAAVHTEKIAIGRAMFGAGKRMFRHTPPWGILTGVRPSKVATELIREGNGILRSRRILRDEYFLNPQKAALAVSVANREMLLTRKMPPRSCSIYVSIPFCPSRCAYCSFVSYTSARLLSLIDDYLKVLYLDLANMVSVIREMGLTVSTVYIGGGTPTVLTAEQLQTLLSLIGRLIDVSSLSEFTLESGRPDTITEEKLAVAYANGVTRISVNPQTLSDEVLRSIGRHHSVAQFYEAYEMGVKSGIRDINVDLIAGLPGDTFANFAKSVDAIIGLAPSNITVHTFCVKKAADILRENSHIYSSTGGDVAKSVSYSFLKTKFAGYLPYYMYRQKNTVGNLENVGYAKDGHEGMYNIYMMEELHSIFAVGAGAVTKLVTDTDREGKGRLITRIFTPKYPYEYLRDADTIRLGDETHASVRDRIVSFYRENGMLT